MNNLIAVSIKKSEKEDEGKKEKGLHFFFNIGMNVSSAYII